MRTERISYHASPRSISRSFRPSALFWGMAMLLCASAMQPVRADPEGGAAAIPRQFSTVACYELVQDAGRMIAWARWERQFPLEKTLSGRFPDGTPAWAVDLVGGWITDAYQWRVTDEQVYEWAAELGNVDNLPHASFEGKDAQLDAAIQHLQQRIREKPVEVPKVPKYPDKSFKPRTTRGSQPGGVERD